MRTLFYLSESQLERVKPFFLMVFLVSMTDARSVIIYVIKPGLQWKAPPDEYGPHKMLYNRFVSWSKLGVFNKIFTELTNQTPFDCSPLKTLRPVTSLLKKGFSTSHRLNKRRPKFETSCRL